MKDGAKCVRCGKDGELVFAQRSVPPPHGRKYYLDGDVVSRGACYHRRCIPPQLFHQFAGSLPVGQSLDSVSSPSNGHGAVGRLSRKRRGRRRPAARQRAIRAKLRQLAESKAREVRLDERTHALTIGDTLANGGRPGLCHCKARYRSEDRSPSYSFLTEYGYCRYCGKWDPAVFLAACGEEATHREIDRLEEWKRDSMRGLIATLVR